MNDVGQCPRGGGRKEGRKAGDEVLGNGGKEGGRKER